MLELTEAEKLCFSCPLPATACDERGRLCRFSEATGNNKHLKTRSITIQHSCGFQEKPLWELNEGMTKFSEKVAGYKEHWMRLMKWENT